MSRYDPIVEAIKKSVTIEQIEVNDLPYVTGKLEIPPPEPLPGTVKIHTLTGLIEFVNSVADKSLLSAIHIVSHNDVRVLGKIEGRHRLRATFAQAIASNQRFPFDQYIAAEDFVIKLQSAFVKTPLRDQLLAIIGSLKDESVRAANDDGVTQTVTTRKGVSFGQETVVPNPVFLAPFRTFAELEQPESAYILRLKRKEGELPSVALFETGDQKWEIETIGQIREFLAEKITDIPIIA